MLVVHLHRHLANNKWPTKLNRFWDWLAERLRHCDVLMGDFNMSLFMVVPEIRSRGVTIDLAAWFPWKMPDGTACADSCGIFFVNRPGQYELVTGLEDLHANDDTGFFWEENVNTEKFLIFERDGAPGFELSCYLPKENVQQKVRESLTPSLSPQALEQQKAELGLFKTLEKRLKIEHFECQGTHQKGSHYPLAVFTKNPSWRSPEKHKQRTANWYYPRASQKSTEGCSRGDQASWPRKRWEGGLQQR